MPDIRPNAANAREQARNMSNGQFGEQHLADPGSSVLTDTTATPTETRQPAVVDLVAALRASIEAAKQRRLADQAAREAARRDATAPALPDDQLLALLGDGPELTAEQLDTMRWLSQPWPGDNTPLTDRLRRVRDTESAAWMAFDQMMADAETAELQPNLITSGGTDQAVGYYDMAVMQKTPAGWATAAVTGTVDSLDPDSDTDSTPLRRAVRVATTLRRRLADAAAYTGRPGWPDNYLLGHCTHACASERDGKRICLSCSETL